MAKPSTLERMALAVEEVLNDFFAVKEHCDDERTLGARIRDALRSSNPRVCDDPPHGWHRFECEYTTDDGSRWRFEVIAQSFEDAETRLRCIAGSGAVAGRIVGDVDGGDCGGTYVRRHE